MSRLLFCGGLFIEGVSSLLTLPGVSQTALAGIGLLGGIMAIIPAAYRLLIGPFSIVLQAPIEAIRIEQ